MCIRDRTTSYMRFGPLFKIRERLVEAQGEARNDFLILAELAQRLGYGDIYPQSEEDMLRFAVEPSGFTLEEVRAAGGEVRVPTVMMQYKKWEKGLLRPDGQPGFNTPSGKFEIASSILVEHGYEPLPVYTEPAEGPLANPDLARTYPLVFNSGARTAFDFRSQHHGVRGLAERHSEPPVTLNREDAKELRIEKGVRVWVETPRGRALFTARLTDNIVRGSIDAAMGGGGPLGGKAWQECNVNELTDIARFDPISGFPIYKALLCRLSKAEGSSPSARNAGVGASAEEDACPIPHPATPGDLPRRVYLDHNATTFVAPEVREAMLPFLSDTGGNPSSIHGEGNRARAAVEAARRVIAQGLNCTARRVVFTGGGSEADNLAILGLARASDGLRRHLITSSIEHPAVLAPLRALAAEGFDLSVLPVNRNGIVEPESLIKAIRPDTLLVSVMLANNETGALQPVRELAEIAHEHGAVFHTDAVQAFGKIPVDVEELGVDLLAVSAHKLHGPKGVGALYVRKGLQLDPLIKGGGQEHGLRAGTENVPGIVGFGKAVELALRGLYSGEPGRVARLRDRLEAGIHELISGAHRNGPERERLPNTLNMTLPEIRGESLVLFLDRKGIAFSSGSACKSGNPEPSHALLAMGLTPAEAHCSVRFSLGAWNTEEEIKYVIEAFSEVLRETRSAVRFVSCR